MAITIRELGIDRLSVRERLDLIEQIRDSLPEARAPDEVPDYHKQVLVERLADANPGGAVPWREALAAIRSRRHGARTLVIDRGLGKLYRAGPVWSRIKRRWRGDGHDRSA